MSVLLDALKKAAEEKKAKNSASNVSDSTLNDAETLSKKAPISKENTAFTLSFNDAIFSSKNEITDELDQMPVPSDKGTSFIELEEVPQHEPADFGDTIPEVCKTFNSVGDDTAGCKETQPQSSARSVSPKSEQSEEPRVELKLADPEPVTKDYPDPLDALDQSEPDNRQASDYKEAVQPSEIKASSLKQAIPDASLLTRANNSEKVSYENMEKSASLGQDNKTNIATSGFNGESAAKPEAKLVKKLFVPTLTTTFKTPRSLYARKIFYLFVSLSVLVLVLGYYALFTFNQLEQDYQHQVQNLQSPGLVSGAQPQTFPSNALEGQELIETNSREKQESQVAVTEIENEKDAQAVPTQKPRQQKTESRPQPLSETSSSQATAYQIRQTERASENELAYQAYLQGDFEKAKNHYQRALDKDNDRVTGLLGLAAIHAEQGNLIESLALFQQVLQYEPGNRYALEGMATVATQVDQSLIDEFELKNLVRQYPKSDILQLAMGNFYASRKDWFQAQAYYFESVKLRPKDPNHRLNLAVSLDHLSQYESALTQYKMSLALSDGQAVAFDLDSVKRRVQALEQFEREF